jgi:uncharacterized membrane protein YbhN (UPF0104 family)
MSDKAAQGWWGRLKRHWPTIRKALLILFVLALVILLVLLARDIDWPKVVHALQAIPASTLWMAVGLVAVSYTIYALFDVVGRAYVKHDLPAWQVMLVSAISYAFNLSLGSFVGGVGFRYRLYSRLGLSNGTVTRILGLSLVTNWLGYFWLAGAVFASGQVVMPKGWEIGTGALRGIGVALLAAALLYVGACGLLRRKGWTVRGHEIELPSFPLALVQSAVAALSWAVIGAIIWVLLEEKIPYVSVLGVLLLSSIAGAVAHIPGGIGVIEAVFVAMLAGKVPRDEILGVLVAYRALYYLGPLAVAGAAYVALEAALKRRDAAAA